MSARILVTTSRLRLRALRVGVVETHGDVVGFHVLAADDEYCVDTRCSASTIFALNGVAVKPVLGAQELKSKFQN